MSVFYQYLWQRYGCHNSVTKKYEIWDVDCH